MVRAPVAASRAKAPSTSPYSSVHSKSSPSGSEASPRPGAETAAPMGRPSSAPTVTWVHVGASFWFSTRTVNSAQLLSDGSPSSVTVMFSVYSRVLPS